MTDIITGENTYRRIVSNPINYIKLLRPGYFLKKRI
jgi:hypothetical protein